jgi:hypothetical protein
LADDIGPLQFLGIVRRQLAVHVAAYLNELDGTRSGFSSRRSDDVPSSKNLHHLDQNEFIRAVGERFGALPKQLTTTRKSGVYLSGRYVPTLSL